RSESCHSLGTWLRRVRRRPTVRDSGRELSESAVDRGCPELGSVASAQALIGRQEEARPQWTRFEPLRLHFQRETIRCMAEKLPAPAPHARVDCPDLHQAIGGTAAWGRLAVAFYSGVDRYPLLRPLFPGKTHHCAI